MDTNLPTDPIVSVNNQSVNSQPQNLKTEKPKRKIHIPKIALLIGFFIILLVLMEGGLFLAKNSSNTSPSPTPIAVVTSTPDPMATWQKGQVGDLSFQYPPIYNGASPCEAESGFFIDPKEVPTECEYGDFAPGFKIFILKNKTLSQVRTEFMNNKYYENKTVEDVSLEGRSGLLTKSVWPPGQDVVSHNDWNLYISDGVNLYVVNSFDLHITPEEQEMYFDKIISTLKFTNSAVSSPPSTFTGSTGTGSMPANPGQTEPAQPIMVACTMEAKLCPDGVTSVGRSGPKCEFEKCPGE